MSRRDPPAPPARNFGYSLEWLRTSPGARKLELRKREFAPARPRPDPPDPDDPGSRDARRRRPRRRTSPLPYAELRAASAFSFLDGASLPEDLVQRAAELGLPAVALLDRNGVYGAPRFYKAAGQAGVRAIVGAEVVLDAAPKPLAASRGERASEVRLSLLVADRAGYRNLCRLLTAAARGRPKGEGRVDLATLERHAGGLWCLAGGESGPVARALAEQGVDSARRVLERLAALFDGRLHVELQRHRQREEEHRNRALVDLARRLRLPLAATNGVRYARPEDKPLHDVLTAIREHVPLDDAGSLLAAHRERHFKSAAEMSRLFADLPEAVTGSHELAERLDFTLANLGYRFPDYPLPPGETPSSYLRHVTWNAARSRFRPLTARAQAQLERELAMIEKLDLAGYFLIVWDVVRFCKRHGILVQGRGSAANSAVCYALSITAVDPVKMELLFERFLSEERGEWPDIDLDLPSGDQREKVIQHVYRRYGPHGAAMTANVITYRDRSAAREVAKALGYSASQVDKLAKQFGRWSYDTSRGDPRSMGADFAAAGFDPEAPRVRLFAEMWRRIHNLPRHLGQHSGGMVIAAGRLDEVVPIEPATMEDRVVVQWDKDDCADLGIIKVDLLGLGMLQALEEAIPLIRTHEGVDVDLAQLPPDDPETYRMLRAADTVGVFQVESRAQMASLPRNAPRRFYDLVIQVAIIRPGPIVGGMVHPYFERRQGRQPVTYPHPSLEPILKRTLGVLLFQEQILRVAMVAAGFTGGEAEDLRRAMGFKRSAERMAELETKLRRGMAERGIAGRAQEQIVHAITSFALYGFPESHAASFALIAYASAFLKAHHPTAFVIALLNAWPMGFYHPATLVKDAQRHGVAFHGIDVSFSGWKCRWEASAGGSREPARRSGMVTGGNGSGGGGRKPPAAKPVAGGVRLGLRFVKGLRKESGEAIEREQRHPFRDVDDLARRCRLRREELDVLAQIGALGSLGLTRRAALWQAARAARPSGPLFENNPADVLPTSHARTEAAPGGGSRTAGASLPPLENHPADILPASHGKPEAAPGGGSRTAGASAPPVESPPRPSGRATMEHPSNTDLSPLPEMSPFERTLADYAGSGLTCGPHPMQHLRPHLARHRIAPAAELDRFGNGERVRTAGSVIVRQRPGTAKGLLFLTLEDETGMSQAIVSRELLQENRRLIVGSAGLVVEGVLQKRDGTLSVKAERFWRLSDLAATPSHDFR